MSHHDDRAAHFSLHSRNCPDSSQPCVFCAVLALSNCTAYLLVAFGLVGIISGIDIAVSIMSQEDQTVPQSS